MSMGPWVVRNGGLRTPPSKGSIVPVRAFLATLVFVAVLSRGALPLSAQEPTATPAVNRPSWYGRLSPATPGAFPPPRSYRADYRITWGGLEAATVETKVDSSADGGQIRTGVKAATTGAARTLYKLDASHISVIDRQTYRPEHFEQTERGSRKNTFVRVDFGPDGATRREQDLNQPKDGENSRKPKQFNYPGLLDMEGVLLSLRSQPLKDGDEFTYLFMTSGNPYLATIKVVGRNAVHVRAGDYAAIECSLKLEKVGKTGELEARKGFKSGRAWLSDDANRLLVKAQTDIFIGSVNLEMEKVSFTDGGR